MPKFNFEKYWQQLIKGIDETPPESVWKNIQDELDIDEVWTKIDQSIPAPVNYWQSGFRMLINIAALLLLLFVPKNERGIYYDQEIINNGNPKSGLNIPDSTSSKDRLALEGKGFATDDKNLETTPKQQIKSGLETVTLTRDINEEASFEINNTESSKESNYFKEEGVSDSLKSFANSEIASAENASDNVPFNTFENDSTQKLSISDKPNLLFIENKVDSKNALTTEGEELPELTKVESLSTLRDNPSEKRSNDISIDFIKKETATQLAKQEEFVIENENIALQQARWSDKERGFSATFHKLDYLKPSFKFAAISLTDSLQQILSINITKGKKSSRPAIQFMSIGVNGAIKNSRLLNNDTRAANSGNSLSSTSFTLAKDLGVSLQWQTRRNQMLQLSYYFVSESAQTYNQYIEARYGQKTLKVNYQTLSAEFIQPIQFINASLIVGPYISKIQSVEESVMGTVRDFTNNYQDWEYGFNLGVQYRYRLTKNFSLQPSVKFQYGLNNIFKGNNLIPANFNSTNPMNISFGIGIYYHLAK